MENWALITGASAGIGYELARLFAADHFNLALVARDEGRLKALAARLEKEQGIATKVMASDLSKRGAGAELFESLRDTPIAALVNNAGFGWQGAFLETELSRSLDMLEVNVEALVELTHLFTRPMVARGHGCVLNVASTAAFQPGPYTAMYYASKAFVFSFSVALKEELRGTGVTVTTLCPGFTRTEFHERARMVRASKFFSMMPADTVARIGYEGMKRGEGIVVAGMMNRLTSFIARRLPAGFTARIVRRINGH
jgi:short-subunit dehydrogenase